MANREVERFLETYRRLEAAASTLMPRDYRGSVIARLLRMPKFAPYREELDCCREVRNLLTHEVRIEGAPAVLPGDTMCGFLEKLIRLIENPPRVCARMTPRAALIVADESTPVREMMERMHERDLSRVPILDGAGRVRGMFSTDTVFLATLHGIAVTPDTRMAELDAYLALDAAAISSYRFVGADLTVDEAENLFSHAYDKKRKLRALLVTEHGSLSEALMGILTPYDILGTE